MVGFDGDACKVPSWTWYSLKHAAFNTSGLRVNRIGPEGCSSEHGHFVDDRMYFAVSIAKLRLDNSRLRLLIYEAHDLDGNARHAYIILLSIYSGDFEHIVPDLETAPLRGTRNREQAGRGMKFLLSERGEDGVRSMHQSMH
jgi:hypothetical protein